MLIQLLNIRSDPYEEQSPGNEEPEQLMSTVDKERLAIVTQIQDCKYGRNHGGLMGR